ncbi:hypothetical protein L1049_015678 [Liquidambar formosana]|uniref:DUF4283 domain-containing protein n=1 Tax=Liquidambar formosana TaxID=63359 RepID=A0AAP0RXZ3_LIQFO
MRDRICILELEPWSVMGALLVLQDWSPDLVLEEINFSSSSFWIQIHKLPPNRKTLANAMKIRTIAGSFFEVDTQLGNDLLWNNFLRVKVAITASQSSIKHSNLYIPSHDAHKEPAPQVCPTFSVLAAVVRDSDGYFLHAWTAKDVCLELALSCRG